MTSIYNGQFSGNILVVGRTNCGKTTFIEKLGLNNFHSNCNNQIPFESFKMQTVFDSETILQHPYEFIDTNTL